MNNTPLPELLAPAGSLESLRAALAAGADAVYFGSTDFSNRMRAKNFTKETIGSAIKLCHSAGAQAHITVNTRIKDRETDELLSLLDVLLGSKEDERPDALIVADFGVARLVKERYPDTVLHASTQTSMMSPADCFALEKLGFKRLVIPREASFNEIASLTKLSPLEIEMFIHGAHCVSCSGQCLMSYVMGGRSGNRGECAQPCRLPYRMESTSSHTCGDYPLSMADMYLGKHIPEIIASGVASLKIEGRLKTPSYVYGVTSIYRRLLDERRGADSSETKALDELFSRGFSDGYFMADYTKMSGKKAAESKTAQNDIQTLISNGLKKRSEKRKSAQNTRQIKARIYLHPSVPAELTLYCDNECVTVYGDVPALSTGNPLSEESTAKNLIKLGGTGYSLAVSDITFDMDPGIWMPLSSINELRRSAVKELDEKFSKKAEKNTIIPLKPTINTGRKSLTLTAEIADLAKFGSDGDLSLFADSFTSVFVKRTDLDSALNLFPKEKIGLNLPVFTPEDNLLSSILKSALSLGVTKVMCHTAGQLEIAKALGMNVTVSFRANISNSLAARTYEAFGADSVTVSPELNPAQARDIASETGADCGIIGYGRLPLMLLSKCIISDGKCPKGNRGGRISDTSVKNHNCSTSLTDRMGESFPVIGNEDCTNTVYNSTVIWMGDRFDTLKLSGKAAFIHFIFTTESLPDACSVIKGYLSGEKRSGRRI